MEPASVPPPRRLDLSELESCSPDHEILPGVEWGRSDVLFTPAYWQLQANLFETDPRTQSHRLAPTLREECVACLLGGHGIPAEVGLAAFSALTHSGLFECSHVSHDNVYNVLSSPLLLPSGRRVRYRFAREKSRCVSELLNSFEVPPDSSHVAIRDSLTRFRGIGLKTASWVVRNWYDSDDVAILDIHIHRAGLIAGFFRPHLTISKHYFQLERSFLEFAAAINVRPSTLDAVIWHQMKRAGMLVHHLLAC